MLNRPGSENGISWFFYKIRRKVHFLHSRGTLFRKKAVEKHFKKQVASPKLPFMHRIRRSVRMTRVVWTDNSPVKEFMKHNYSFLGNGKYLVIILNSIFIFLLAYLFVFVLRELAVVMAASSFDIRSVMMYYDVEFLIRSRDWTEEAVKVVFSTGPVIAFMLTLVSLTIFVLSSQETWMARLFILWVILHAFTQSLGEMIIGALLNQGFGWVLAYLYFNDTEKMLLVVGFLLGMFAGGLFLSRFLLLTGNIYFNSIGRSNRRPFLISQIYLPFLIGTGMLILLKQPLKNGFEMLIEGSMILVLLPAFLWTRNTNELFFDEEPRKIRISWGWISVTILAVILFRILFWKGIRL